MGQIAHRIIAAAVPIVCLADPDENAWRIVTLIQRAAEKGATELHLPHRATTGVTCGDLSLQPLLAAASARAESVIRHAAREAGLKVYFQAEAPCHAILGTYPQLVEKLRCRSLATDEPVIYVSPGYGESTTDYVYAGDAMIFHRGTLIAASERFSLHEQLVVASIDGPVTGQRIASEGQAKEILQMQSIALATRLTHTGIQKAVIGVSGGLDSTWALIATCHTFDRLNLPRSNIIAITMPGFGTGGRTYRNAIELMSSMGVTMREISIRNACEQHFQDIGLISHKGASYENAQARERTQILMDVANMENALVIGTGDLSELALGWCTYNGDQMSMYSLNASLPKTLIQTITREYAEGLGDEREDAENSNFVEFRRGIFAAMQCEADGDVHDVPPLGDKQKAAKIIREKRKILLDIVDTPISPELLATDQHTENIVGPYELHDAFLEGFILRHANPAELLDDAQQQFHGKYDRQTILRWMRVFFARFFANQFKRSAMPDGPKITAISLSPRGAWNVPSDASASLWLREIDNLIAS